MLLGECMTLLVLRLSFHRLSSVWGKFSSEVSTDQWPNQRDQRREAGHGQHEASKA